MTPTTDQLRRGFAAMDARAADAAAVRQETVFPGPFTARCLVGGCEWAATHASTLHLEVLANLHRDLLHPWVRVGHCHSLT